VIEHLNIDAGGQHLYAAAAGPADGPLVIMLHGFPEISYGWRAQILPLAEAGLRVVAPDQRGYGWSGKPEGVGAYALDELADDIVQLAAALGRDRARLVGHDWGGLVAWVLAARQPDFVERAAILNAPHPATVVPEMLRHPFQAVRSSYIGFFQLPWLPELALSALDHAALTMALTSTSRPGTFDAEALRVYRQAWSLPGALKGMLNWYRALHRAPNLDAHPVHVPVRIIWGERDAALNAGLADRALAKCVHGEVFRLPQATHWLHHEEPARVNALLREFLVD
jgi:pimeloyl-ACP methyl ester carboxylesterase